MKTIDQLIEEHCYEGILGQDGWETLELTVRANHPKYIADQIILRLEELAM